MPANYNKAIECGITFFSILGKRKRIIKNVLATNAGQNIGDLKLLNIYIIKGFYSNIILKVKLLKVEVWYYNLNCILYFGLKKDNIILRKLKRKSNLVFFKYKPLTIYLNALLIIISIIIYFATR